MPELRQIGQPTIVEGMDVENQQMERDGKRIKRPKSTSAIDTTLLEPLHMLKAKGREGVATCGYHTISMDDIFSDTTNITSHELTKY